MGFVDQVLGGGAVHTGQADVKFDFDAKAVGDGANAYSTWILASAGTVILAWPATNFIAPKKQAL